MYRRLAFPLLALIGCVAAGAAGGCETTSGPERPDQAGAPRFDAPVAKPAGARLNISVRTAILPLGSVPYDEFSLPMLSPDGRFLATQTGIAPTWPTVLADLDAEVPAATRVEVYEFDEREDSVPGFVRRFSVDVPAILGRSADSRGFLIEAPRDDGARWIGYVHWATGEIDWLVADENINAFASLGPDGRLAYSRRRQLDFDFDLVVVDSTGDVWEIPAETAVTARAQSSNGDDDGNRRNEFSAAAWLMPTWSGYDDGMFVLRLIDDQLSLNFVRAANPVAFRQSQRSLTLSRGAGVRTAYQSFIGARATQVPERGVNDQIVFWHPGEGRMCVWRPRGQRPHGGPSGPGPFFLDSGSYAAEVTEARFALVSSDDGLLRQDIESTRIRAELFDGTYIPRAVNDEQWPYRLFSTGEPGRMGLFALRLLPPR